MQQKISSLKPVFCSLYYHAESIVVLFKQGVYSSLLEVCKQFCNMWVSLKSASKVALTPCPHSFQGTNCQKTQGIQMSRHCRGPTLWLILQLRGLCLSQHRHTLCRSGLNSGDWDVLIGISIQRPFKYSRSIPF